MASPEPIQQRYLKLVAEIEQRFAVSRWRSGDIDLWPPARMDLFLDMFATDGRATAPPPPSFIRRAAGGLATPLTNLWKSRHDLAHWMPWPRRAQALILGDGVSLDRVGGAWQDRYGEPIAAALESGGRKTLMMQPGDLKRLPWRRPTFAVNSVSAWGALIAAAPTRRTLDLPDHEALLTFLDAERVAAPSLNRDRLARRARTLASTSWLFQQILRRVRPNFAFVVTCYAGLGHAFALACRREAVLCIDLQHCPQDGAHKAYGWRGVPDHGYTTLPALFWNWREDDAAFIQDWASALPSPWHQSLHGGHTQIIAHRDGPEALLGSDGFDREILVALQPIGGHRASWDALADIIESGPPRWRWWIRRHPSSTPAQDADYARLLTLRRPNLLIDEASQHSLPALLPHMSALVSLASGAAGEAAMFGVPAFFLSDEARGTFPGLIARGDARIIEPAELLPAISGIQKKATVPPKPAPPLGETLSRLERIAEDYARLCSLERRPALSRTGRSATRSPRVGRGTG